MTISPAASAFVIIRFAVDFEMPHWLSAKLAVNIVLPSSCESMYFWKLATRASHPSNSEGVNRPSGTQTESATLIVFSGIGSRAANELPLPQLPSQIGLSHPSPSG